MIAGKKTNKPVKCKLFRCIEKQTGKEMYGIIYPDGTIHIGLDVWRNLKKSDCASWPVQIFRSVADVASRYTLVSPTFKKFYFMDT